MDERAGHAGSGARADAGRWATVGCVAAAAFGLIVLAPGRVPQAGAEPPDGAVAEADRLLREAADALDAAALWLRGRADELPDEDAARRWLEGMVERAAARPAPTGVRIASWGPASDSVAARREVMWTELAVVEGALSRRVVLLAHGLDEPGSIWDEMTPALLEEGFAVARFDYPNDQRIADSADFMAEWLRELAGRGVERVDIVAHSMGGLVARDVLTRPEYYGGVADAHDGLPDVGRLITVGTPHTGSPWASLQAVSEMREQFARWIKSDGKDVGALLGLAEDGDGQAGEDLKPGSAFLTDLNARPIPTGVKITCIRATMTPEEARGVMSVLRWPAARRLMSEEQIARLSEQGDSLIRKLGDGVVPHESAALAGVEDVVDLEGNHRTMLMRGLLNDARRAVGKDSRVAPAILVILERLKESTERP